MYSETNLFSTHLFVSNSLLGTCAFICHLNLQIVSTNTNIFKLSLPIPLSDIANSIKIAVAPVGGVKLVPYIRDKRSTIMNYLAIFRGGSKVPRKPNQWLRLVFFLEKSCNTYLTLRESSVIATEKDVPCAYGFHNRNISHLICLRNAEVSINNGLDNKRVGQWISCVNTFFNFMHQLVMVVTRCALSDTDFIPWNEDQSQSLILTFEYPMTRLEWSMISTQEKAIFNWPILLFCVIVGARLQKSVQQISMSSIHLQN